MDYRFEWEDHAIGFEENIIVVAENYWKFAEIFPRFALSVSIVEYSLIFVNTPMLFDTIWAKVSSSIAKQTLQKIIMIGDETASLYQYAQQAILP